MVHLKYNFINDVCVYNRSLISKISTELKKSEEPTRMQGVFCGHVISSQLESCQESS